MVLRNLRRVVREVQHVNHGFHSLRIVLRMNKSNFVMLMMEQGPHLPLIGEVVIPERYPTNPPVFHLSTKTFRYNVDVFSSHVNDDTGHSAQCALTLILCSKA